MMAKKFTIVGAILLILGVVLGAFGAHALKQVLVEYPDKISSFETGIRYQIYMGFSFLIIGLNEEKLKFSLKPIFTLWLLGVLFFSCSIYFLSLQPILTISLKFLGPITPIGGLLIISGWIVFLFKVLKMSKI